MMTLDSIRNVEFTKGRGYRAEEVDDFIDACAATVEQLIREREDANQKLKLLADKVAEYRNEEDSIRAALLNAQRTGDTVLREASEKASQIKAEAQKEAEQLRADAQSKIEAEKAELERVQAEVSAFKARILSLYKEHLALIQVLPEPAAEVVSQPEAPVAEPAEAPAEAPVSPEAPAEDVVVAPPTEETAAVSAEEVEMKPLSRFANLKFGNDYDIHADEDDEDTFPVGSRRGRK